MRNALAAARRLLAGLVPPVRTGRRSALLLIGLLAPLWASPAAALPQKNRSWTGQMAAGYTAPSGVVDDLFLGGATFAVGATYKPKRSPIGAWAELGYNGFDVNGPTLEAIGVQVGDLRIWSVTGGFIWPIHTKNKVDLYVLGGVGWYRAQVELLNPSFDTIPPGCATWWDWCQPETPIPTAEIVGSRTATEPGYDGGLGLTFTVKNRSEIYIELKYHRIETEVPTELYPFAVGYRW